MVVVLLLDIVCILSDGCVVEVDSEIVDDDWLCDRLIVRRLGSLRGGSILRWGVYIGGVISSLLVSTHSNRTFDFIFCILPNHLQAIVVAQLVELSVDEHAAIFECAP